MKNIILFLLTLLLISCNNATDPTVQIPSLPCNPIPTDGAIDQPCNLYLRWEYADTNYTVFDICFSSDSGMIEEDWMNTIVWRTEKNYVLILGLNDSTTYYWQVVVEISNTEMAKGPIWKFETGE